MSDRYVKAKAAIKAEQQRERQAKVQRKGFGIGKRLSALKAIQGSLHSYRLPGARAEQT